MSNILNLSLVEGRLTKDPQLLYTKSGKAVCKFDIAINSNCGKTKEPSSISFIAINAWNRVAECCAKYLRKGNLIRANGRLRQNSWEGKDGKKRSIIVVDAANVEFLGSPSRRNENIPA